MRLLLLWSCGADPGEKATDTPYVVDEGELDLPAPSVDAAAIEAAAATAMGVLGDLDADVLIDAYEALLEGADSDCPTWYPSDDGDYWYDTCTSGDGTAFDGYAIEVVYDGVEDGGYTWDARGIYGFGTVTDPTGATLVLDGTAVEGSATTDQGVSVRILQLDGGFSWDGDSAEGTWLSTGLEPAVDRTAYALGDLRVVFLSGTIQGIDASIDTVVFEEMVFASEGTGVPCALEPAGTLSVRDAEGHWTDVLFDLEYDVATEAFSEIAEVDCDGCGEAWFQGQRVGEVCLDVALALEPGD